MTPSGEHQPGNILSRIDLRKAEDARVWTHEAEAKRPWRTEVRAEIADLLHGAPRPIRRVLELGSGPGLLAEQILTTLELDNYTLFDFSEAMLSMSRERLLGQDAAAFVLGDFKREGWARTLLDSAPAPFDAVVTMQAVHEVRHKRHVPALYREIGTLLRPGGIFVVCDHAPPDSASPFFELHSTVEEQHSALAVAGFVHVRTYATKHGVYLCGGQRPGASGH